jgi:hypothetical protein
MPVPNSGALTKCAPSTPLRTVTGHRPHEWLLSGVSAAPTCKIGIEDLSFRGGEVFSVPWD